MSLTSSRDSWERLVTAVVKKQQIWELCHQQSFTTINSDDLSEQTLSFSSTNYEPSSVSQSPLLSFKNSSISQVKTTAISNDSSSRSVTRKLFSGWYGRKKSKDHDLVDIPTEFPAGYLGQLERYSYYQLQVATNKFSDKNILGRGGFGVVYKGRLVDDTLVAIKRFQNEQTTGGAERGFHREIEVFSIMPEHRNLLSLRGFCMTSKEWFLIYPYMVNGSLASCLRERPPNVPQLDWGRRKSIALGCARGLSYLHDHCDPKIVHRDVKAANILLDEEYEAIVGDFGLAKLMDHNDTDVVRGTIGHIAPEHLFTGEASQKTDVFAYGITLLELITGQKPNDLACLANDDDAMLLDWVKWLLKENKLETLVDPNLQGNYVDEEVEQLMQVALLCTQNSALRRPRMSEVERLLDGDGLSEKWEEWQKNSLLEVELARYPTTDWIIVDSVDDLDAIELSGPR